MIKRQETIQPAAETEAAMIGAVILDPARIEVVLPIITNEAMIYTPRFRAVWRAMVDLWKNNQPIDVVRIVQWGADHGLPEVDAELVTILSESVPSAALAEYYATGVLARHNTIMAVDTLSRATNAILSDPSGVAEAMATVQSFIVNQGDQVGGDPGLVPLGVLVGDESSRVASGEVVKGLSWGFPELDSYTGGLFGAELTIIAGRPSMGKTSFALAVIESFAAQFQATGEHVAVFSIEMSKKSLAQRFISYRTNISHQSLRTLSGIGDIEASQIYEAAETLTALPVLIDDKSNLTPMQMRAKVKRASSRHKIGAIVVDYIQLMGADERMQRRDQELAEIARQAKSLGKEMGIPVVMLAQINRGNEARENKRPTMSDLKESGGIEEVADVVAMIHRDDYYQRNNPGHIPTNTAEIIIAKQRNGGPGIVKIGFDTRTGKFVNQF